MGMVALERQGRSPMAATKARSASSISALSLTDHTMIIPGPTSYVSIRMDIDLPVTNYSVNLQEGGPHLCNVAFTDSFVQFPDPISWATLVGIGSPPSAYDLYSSQNMYGAIISISLLGRFSVNNISSSGQHSPQNICKLLSSMQIV
uniref:Uncharacterized protein n=1 Tax=Oryza rufipogon TaxID=4529 RepID=A0A0E0RCK8_ORYRU